MFPNAFIIPMSREMTITQWHVPVDDTKHYWYAIFTSFGQPVNKDEMRRQRLELYELPDYMPRKNKHNDYGFDPHEQEHETYTGMGADINVHDQWACESMGEIQDRTREHLGQSDKAITAYRRLLRNAIDDARRAAASRSMVLDPQQRAGTHRPRRDRRHRPDRRLAGLLAEDRRGQAQGRELGEWAVISIASTANAVMAGLVPAISIRLARRCQSIGITGCSALRAGPAMTAEYAVRANLRRSKPSSSATISGRRRSIAPRRRSSARSRSTSSKSVRFAFVDQHGMLRGKTLVAAEAASAMRAGVTMTTTLLAKDTSHRTVFPVFTAGGG